MKRQLFTFLILLLTFGSVYSQSKAPTSFVLNGRLIHAESNVVAVKKAYQANLKKKSSASFCILQFEKVPDNKEQAALNAKGVKLLNYISNNAYYAQVYPAFYGTSGGSDKIRSIIEIKPEYKLNPALTVGKIPDYAKGKGDEVKVVISYFEQVSQTQISEDMKALGLSSFKIISTFNQVNAVLPRSYITKVASFNWVQNIELTAPPKKTNNLESRTMYHTNILSSNALGVGYGLTGKGIKIGLWDSDVEQPRDFSDRIFVHEFEDHDPHGTHTCGTIAGAGIVDPRARGMAPDAIVHTWNFNMQSNELTVQEERELCVKNDGIELTSNSWGYAVGSCPNPFDYNSEDRNEDLIANRYPYFLYVFASGNDQGICSSGYRTTSKNQKNSLIVAAVDKENNMSNFSSFGPSFDGRLIPNITGDGVGVYSTWYNNSYALDNGTSMATPGVAGTMALVYQRYKDTHNGAKPLSSFMRALACNTATDKGNPGPDYQFGYGILNGQRAVESMEKNYFFMDSIAQGNNITKDITVPAGAIGIKVMLAWTDKEGTPGAPKVLVNDLDLKLIRNTTTTLPWILNPAAPNDNAVRGVDTMNNMEQITIDSGLVAGTYTIKVSGSFIPAGKQVYAVVYDFIMPQLKFNYPIGGENFNPGDLEVIRWDCDGYNKPFTLEYSSDNGVNYKTIASGIPSHIRSYNWIVPASGVANAKFRISTGSTLDVTKGSFSIETTPESVHLPAAQCGVGNYMLTWDSVPNASYKVYKLNYQEFQFLANANTNSYSLSGLSTGNDNYYCVRAVDKTTGAVSQRSLAAHVNIPVNVSNLPFSENFSNQSAPNLYFNSKNGKASIRHQSFNESYALMLEGPSAQIDTAWNGTATTPDQCFAKNPEYISRAGICNINTQAFAGKKIMLQFQYRQKFRTAPGTSYFRVKINGNYVKSTDSTVVYGDYKPNYSYAYYDISAFAGISNVNLEFEGVFETNYFDGMDYYNDMDDFGDFVAIDNIKIVPLTTDLSLTNLFISPGLTSHDTVFVAVKNLSGNTLTNIPLSYRKNGLTTFIDTIKTPLPSFGEIVFPFSQKINSTVDGVDTIVAAVNFALDSNYSNNTRSTIIYIDKTSLRIGSDTMKATCGAVFTDEGGKYLNYLDNQYYVMTIKPDSAGKNSRVTFTEFETEDGFDYLTIYDGPNTSSPVLGNFTGSLLPPSFISTAAGGELTFEFSSDPSVNYNGWMAELSCVNKPAVDMVAQELTRTGSPDSSVIRLTVQNGGTQTVGTYNVYYQINNNTPVNQLVNTSIGAGAETIVTFTSKANLSAITTHTVKAWVKASGDLLTANDTALLIFPNYFDAAIMINDVVPNRTAKTELSGTVFSLGGKSVDSIAVAYKINGGTEVKQKIAWPAGSESVDFLFSNLNLSAANTYDIKAYLVSASDIDHSNDTAFNQVVKVANAATNVVASFNTHDAVVMAPPIPATNLQTNFSFECWAKLGRETLYGRIIEKGTFRLYYSLNESAYPENSYILNVNNANGGFTVYYPATVKPDQWQHIAVTVSSSAVYTLYLDGVPQTAMPYSGTVGPPSSNEFSPLFIGNRGSLDRAVDGYIDEYRIWNTVLTQAKIQANMYTDMTVGIADSNLTAYYKFKEGSGSFVYDYSANDNTAIVSGTDVSTMGNGKFWNGPGNLLSNFTIAGQRYPTSFNPATNTFSIIMRNANLSSLVGNFVAEENSTIRVGTTTQTSGVTSNNFTNPVTYLLSGFGFNTGITQSYQVAVTNEIVKDSVCDLTAFWFDTLDNSGKPQILLVKNGSNFTKKISGVTANSLKARFTIPSTAKLYIDDVLQGSPQTVALDYSKPIMVKVLAEDGVNMKYYAIFLDTRSNQAKLISFAIPGEQIGSTVIDTANHTVNLIVKPVTNLNILSPSFSVSPKANLYAKGITQYSGISSNNFSAPSLYQVLSEDETNLIDWMVTATKLVQVDSLNVSGTGGASTITTKSGTLQMLATVFPANATIKNVSWSVSNGTGQASISAAGLLTAISNGTVTVKAKALDSSNVEGTKVITISNQIVGISELNPDLIRVYPNPASTMVYIEKMFAGRMQLVVYDLLGKTIMEKTSDELLSSLDISHLPAGLYFIGLRNVNNEQLTYRFVKQ